MLSSGCCLDRGQGGGGGYGTNAAISSIIASNRCPWGTYPPLDTVGRSVNK